ncbi:MAG: ATP-binding protein [Alphaproteobacteria bacterium]
MLLYILISGERDIDKTDEFVRHTYEVISKAEQLSGFVESMLAAQRGYIITRDPEFKKTYETRKKTVLGYITDIRILTQDNAAQATRLDELTAYFREFSKRLEERAEKYTTRQLTTPQILERVEAIETLKGNILLANHDILEDEYRLLENRIDLIQDKKGRYFTTLFVGVILASALLLLFNGFLLRAQTRRTYAETILKETEERFRLAIEGTNDGIFDWNLEKKQLFWSPQFKKMLGYKEHELTASVQEFERLVHDADIEDFNKTIELYFRQEISEFSAVFRIRHKSDRWLWINARGKAAFNRAGKATRMVGAYTDITALKDYEQRLEESRTHAEKANEAKSDFLAHMSHEIRTPLTAISGIAEIFDKNKDTMDERQKKLVGTLNSSTSALKDLIHDILDFSKIETGELELNLDNFRLESLFQEVISMMSVRAPQKNINFLFDYSPVGDMTFYGDIARMRQILVNLVGNALKFTEKGEVTIKAYTEDRNGSEYLVIDITDTGIGIPPEHQDLIFERFKQADASMSRKYGGTGLGLPISRNLAFLMGGTITLSSEIGMGSKFSVILPFLKAGEDNVNTGRAINENTTLQILRRLKNLKEKSRILLAEDYEGNIVVISYILDEMHCRYDIARTGRQALELWKKNHYDLVLMDIQMPEMDGLSVCSSIRLLENEQGRPRTPIIGMTAHALVGDKDKCIQAGMDAYLPKPIVESDLKEQILKYFEPSQAA